MKPIVKEAENQINFCNERKLTATKSNIDIETSDKTITSCLPGYAHPVLAITIKP